ncbi:response regulator [Mariniblastus fucicola]|uniref:Phosphate regulon transcriptional regulatory protein PhoB n=1 Tax=Mariniblastus fucicola TaxID=980251 RepID=A0A5B9P630_9BACT|nr:response regulator [Mariniblastus fucicola]QEG21788.1 Phosphate regulon transcriptional regulatory protein PhoB [Mariniblastus fucicola]
MSKILAVDDCSSTRAYLKKLGWKWNIEFVAVENGEDALAELEKPDAPQILLVDWVMPGMQGDELIRHIRSQETDTLRYIIMMTAKNKTEDIEGAFAAGADDYMIKPLDPNEIRARLGEGERVLFRDQSINEAFGQIGN